MGKEKQKRPRTDADAPAPRRSLKSDLDKSGRLFVGREKDSPVMSTRRHGSKSFGIFDRHKSSPALAMARTSCSISSSDTGDGTLPTAGETSCDNAITLGLATPALLPPSPSPSRSQSERRSSSSAAMVKKLTRAASRSSEGLRSLVGRNKTLGHVGEELRKASFAGGDYGLMSLI